MIILVVVVVFHISSFAITVAYVETIWIFDKHVLLRMGEGENINIFIWWSGSCPRCPIPDNDHNHWQYRQTNRTFVFRDWYFIQTKPKENESNQWWWWSTNCSLFLCCMMFTHTHTQTANKKLNQHDSIMFVRLRAMAIRAVIIKMIDIDIYLFIDTFLQIKSQV